MGRGRGRRGGGGRGGGDDGGGRFEDQYGESMTGQDRAEHFGFAGRGGGGGTKGGDAGSRSKPGNDVSFVRHVPKFLQAHAHLLGKPVDAEPEPETLQHKRGGGGRDEDGEDDDEQEALRRAVEQDPGLVLQHPELRAVADQAEAEKIKAQGNAAFTAGKLEEAVRLFTQCIELDGSNHIYYSNRAAALTGLEEYAGAARDARRCSELKPQWAKGWSRLGQAYYGLEDFSRAREAYQKACRLEPNDAQLQAALQKAAAREERDAAEGKHKFKRKVEAADERRQEKRQTVGSLAARKEKTLLSFGDEQEEGA